MAESEPPGPAGAAPPSLSLVESACLRPEMYTLGGSFAELVCFLEGLFSGERRAGGHPTPRAEAWGRLSRRLRRESAEGGEGGGWQAGFIALRRRCPDDTTALGRLAALYRDAEVESAREDPAESARPR